ncbi:hypothetical protein JCM5296_005033 [Sporobolomyces johnsonii]
MPRPAPPLPPSATAASLDQLQRGGSAYASTLNECTMDLEADSHSGSSSEAEQNRHVGGGPEERAPEGKAAGKARKRRGQGERRLRRQAAMADPKVHTAIDKQMASHKRRTDTLLFRAREMAHTCSSDVILLSAHDRILSKANAAPAPPFFESYFSDDLRDKTRKVRCAARYNWQNPILRAAFGTLTDESDPNWPTMDRLSGMIHELFGCLVQDKQEQALIANLRKAQAAMQQADEALAKADEALARAKQRLEVAEAREAEVQEREEALRAELERLQASQAEEDQMVVVNLRASGVPEETLEKMLAGLRAARSQVHS